MRQSFSPFNDYSQIGAVYSTEEWSHYRFEFNMDFISDYTAQIVFDCGQSVSDLYIDNVSLTRENTQTTLENIGIIGEKYELYQNYPNPFNPSTTLSFNLARKESVVIEVFNISGQKVLTILNKTMRAGKHMIEFDDQNLASGIYYYRIETENFQDIKKMILIN